jgi:hypothetical protein
LKRLLVAVVVLVSAAAAFAACSQLMILGTYHMDNPGMDAVNLQADDVLSARRQAELDELVEKLARYRPTKIAIEAPYRNNTWPDRYKQSLAATYTPGRNEIEQVAFRLAKKMSLPTLYPVDYPMWMNGWTPAEMEPVQKNAKWDSGSESKEEKKAAPKPAAPPNPEDEILRNSTVAAYLRRLNSPAVVAENHAHYMDALMPSKSVGIYEQTDLVTNWYKRNLRIFTNLNRVAEFPGDRVLLVIGSGHLTILKQFAAQSKQWCVIDAMDFL